MLLTIKFGGTSVGDAQRIRNDAEWIARVRAEGHQVVVVTSAMSKVTDKLVALAQRATDESGDDDQWLAESFQVTRQLQLDHEHTAGRAIRSADIVEAVTGRLYAERRHLERVLLGSHLLGDFSPIGYDYVVSAGERLSVPILAGCLRDLGIEAVGLGGDEAGIRTNNNYGSAVPDMGRTREEVRKALLPLLQAGKVPVVAGFFGRSEQGRIAILGRGGSDYSATLIGCALDADEIWIMTDVPGIKTTDPRLVPSAYVLPEITYQIAAEMALLGAKVLHPKSVLPAARQKIPLRTASSFEPDLRGTYLVPRRAGQPAGVTALTLVRRGALIRANSPEMATDEHLAVGMIEDIRRHNVDIMAHAAGFNGGSLLWLVGPLDADNFLSILERHKDGSFEAEVHRDVAVIGIVGEQVATAPGTMLSVAQCLDEVHAAPLAILRGASPNSIIIALPDNEKQLAAVLAAMHERLIPAPSSAG
jgi:aspartate kinase